MITNGILRQVICLLRQASLKGQGVLPHVQSVFPHNLLPLGRCPQADTDRVFPGGPRIRSMHDRFALREILAIWRVFITLLVLTGFAHATTYYVATNGKDSQTGTSSKPWLTISHADKVVQPGDTVIVEPGTYNVGNYLETSTSGTASQRITFTAQNPGTALIRSTGKGDDNPVWVVNGSYTNYSGFDLQGAGTQGFDIDGGHNTFSNNYVHDLGVGGCGYGAGFMEQEGTPGQNLISANVIKNMGYGTGSQACRGIKLGSTGTTVQNNVIYNASASCIELYGPLSGNPANIIIVNNTLFNCAIGVLNGGDSNDGTSSGVYVANNIIANNSQYGISECGCDGTGNTYTNNLTFNNNNNMDSGGVLLNNLTSDPKFINYNPTGTGNYALSSGSPAINAGTSTNAPATDIVGTTRPQGTAWDIGAYEYVEASSTTTLVSGMNPSIYGGAVTFTATVASGATGTVTFFDGGVSIGTGTLSSGSVALTISTLIAGTHSITATYSGDANYNGSASSAVVQTVNKATPTVTWATPSAIAYGIAVSATQLDATGSVQGTFAYSPSAGTVLTVGPHTLSVTFTPTDTADYTTATGSVTLTVMPSVLNPTLTLAASATPPYVTGTSQSFVVTLRIAMERHFPARL